jgi:hypothetical protein
LFPQCRITDRSYCTTLQSVRPRAEGRCPAPGAPRGAPRFRAAGGGALAMSSGSWRSMDAKKMPMPAMKLVLPSGGSGRCRAEQPGLHGASTAFSGRRGGSAPRGQVANSAKRPTGRRAAWPSSCSCAGVSREAGPWVLLPAEHPTDSPSPHTQPEGAAPHASSAGPASRFRLC